MTAEDLETYLASLGYKVETVTAPNQEEYTVIRDVTVSGGTYVGRQCDVALLRCTSDPYALPAAIHTRPTLASKGTLNIQGSNLGADWANWSRRLDRPPTPKAILTHILTVLSEV